MATLKQKRALALVVEKGRSVSSAMREVGYSPQTAVDPGKLTRSKGWAELMQKHFPDSKLANLHRKFLEKKEVIVVSDGAREGSHLEWTGQPHPDALKALELAHKLKGRPSSDPLGNTTNIQINVIRFNADNNPAPIHAEAISTDSPAGN